MRILCLIKDTNTDKCGCLSLNFLALGKDIRMRNIIIVIIALAAIWWAVENPHTAQKVVDTSKSAVTKIVNQFTD